MKAPGPTSLLGTETTEKRLKRFKALDAWRGVCATLVALAHLEAFSHFYAWPFVRGSYLFVDFFFVLSGFVITHSTVIANANGAGEFIVRRFGRLWPLHIAVLIAFVALELVRSGASHFGYPAESAPFSNPAWSPSAIVRNVLLAQGIGADRSETWNLPSWSISAEFYTYLVFAWICCLSAKWRTLTCSVLLLGGASALFVLSPTYIATEFDYGIFRCFYGFFTGHFVYRLYRASPQSLAWFANHSTLSELLCVAGVLLFVSLAGIGPWSMLAPPVFGLAVFVFANEAGAVSGMLRLKYFQSLGDWSYSIYMVHMLLLTVLTYAVRAAVKMLDLQLGAGNLVIDGQTKSLLLIGNQWWMDLLALGFLLSLAITASISYRVIETPARIYFNGLAKRIFRVSAIG